MVVTASAAQQFALIVHELATNAAKYGALSQASGRVAIEGVRENGVGWFRWKEVGGPPVSQATRKGFGSVLLVDAARPWGDSVTITFAPQGLTYELAMTLKTIEVENVGRARLMAGARTLGARTEASDEKRTLVLGWEQRPTPQARGRSLVLRDGSKVASLDISRTTEEFVVGISSGG